jgi:hypothetical protein
MRALPALLAALAATALAAPAAAQDDDLPGCTQGNPCEVYVDLESTGIAQIEETSFTRGDWILLSVFNGDDVNHTLTVEGKGISITVRPDDLDDTRPFELDRVGTVTLRDAPTGDTLDLTVGAEESFTGGTSDTGTGTGSGRGTPSAGPALLLAALAGGAFLLRRRA